MRSISLIQQSRSFASRNLIHRAGLFSVPKEKSLFIDESGTKLSYGKFLTKTGQYAATLHEDYKIQKGDRVLSRIEKSIDAVALYLACLQIGAIYVPLNPDYKQEETKHFIQDAEPKLFVTSQLELDKVHSESVSHIVVDKQLKKMIEQKKAATDVESMRDEETASICYTSGTTGKPKGAMLTHGSLSSNGETLAKIWGFTENDRLLHMLPFYHVHGMFISLSTTLFSHSSLIWLPRFSEEICLRHLAQSTVLMGIPTYYSRLLSSPQFQKSSIPPQFRLFISGSAPLSLAIWEEFEKRTGHRILERYGMTEAQVICSNLYDVNGRIPGSVGKPIPGTELRLNVNDGIEIRSPALFSGYWRNPVKTKEDMTDDGYFITGDVGRIDDNGFLHIMGRSKDLVISGGLNIYPKEIEDVVDKLDGVHESALIGLPHRDLGEALVAVVALRNGVKLDEKAIREKLKAQLAGYKIPKRVLFISKLPRNSMGKG
ncbi:unnamed protein product, partial [Mesorhabditis belari]|uniref:Malonyl-CoA synthase n=1 Tax=Mesorhabditis belari TaxID=2138241 RepID=A0AAF3FKZ8_9BILA